MPLSLDSLTSVESVFYEVKVVKNKGEEEAPNRSFVLHGFYLVPLNNYSKLSTAKTK